MATVRAWARRIDETLASTTHIGVIREMSYILMVNKQWARHEIPDLSPPRHIGFIRERTTELCIGLQEI
jgi:hypothetical protein